MLDVSRCALLLVDVQRDFFSRPGLVPGTSAVATEIARTLDLCRRRSVAVGHARTRIAKDGSDRMPHWKRAGQWLCVEGTAGYAPLHGLEARPQEPLFHKTFYSAFEDPELQRWLSEQGTRTLILVGAFLHACVRSTALDAYQGGLEVLIIDDAVTSSEPTHAELTRRHLMERAATFVSRVGLGRLFGEAPESRPDALPVCMLGGARRHEAAREVYVHRSPLDGTVLAEVSLGEADDVERAVLMAHAEQARWQATPLERRIADLDSFAAALARRRGTLVDLIVREVGKPLRAAEEEVTRAFEQIEDVRAVARSAAEQPVASRREVSVRYDGLGTFAAITPFNNPLAMAVGKLFPALALGNAVVWKPSPQASLTALLVLDAFRESSVPSGLLSSVFGGALTASALMRHPLIAGVSLTGSLEAGHAAQAICAARGARLQAELGGNNAAVVARDADLGRAAAGVVESAFTFAGQRCTALRRVVVEEAALGPLVEALSARVCALRVGDPRLAVTTVGPVISSAARERLGDSLRDAIRHGCRELATASVEGLPEGGAWVAPTLLLAEDPGADIVQREAFGPLLVVQPARTPEQAIELANGVPHGLVAALFSTDPELRQEFLAKAQAGIVRLGPGAPAFDVAAPFGGWKASGLGPAEHGRWDLDFYARPQTVYRAPGSG